VGAHRHRRHGMGGGGEAVLAEGAERRRGADAGGARVRDVLIQQNPVIVKIVQPSKETSELAQLRDVLIGSLGLTGAIVLAAGVPGAAVAAVMFWVRRRSA